MLARFNNLFQMPKRCWSVEASLYPSSSLPSTKNQGTTTAERTWCAPVSSLAADWLIFTRCTLHEAISSKLAPHSAPSLSAECISYDQYVMLNNRRLQKKVGKRRPQLPWCSLTHGFLCLHVKTCGGVSLCCHLCPWALWFWRAWLDSLPASVKASPLPLA